MIKKDLEEFKLYLRNCTDRQVWGCLEKEKKAGREDYVELCENELERRNLK